MKKLISCILAALLICTCLSACVENGDNTQESTTAETTEATQPQEQTIPNLQIPQEETITGSVTLPEIEMPTKPEADYQLPPGETPGKQTITE